MDSISCYVQNENQDKIVPRYRFDACTVHRRVPCSYRQFINYLFLSSQLPSRVCCTAVCSRLSPSRQLLPGSCCWQLGAGAEAGDTAPSCALLLACYQRRQEQQQQQLLESLASAGAGFQQSCQVRYIGTEPVPFFAYGFANFFCNVWILKKW